MVEAHPRALFGHIASTLVLLRDLPVQFDFPFEVQLTGGIRYTKHHCVCVGGGVVIPALPPQARLNVDIAICNESSKGGLVCNESSGGLVCNKSSGGTRLQRELWEDSFATGALVGGGLVYVTTRSCDLSMNPWVRKTR